MIQRQSQSPQIGLFAINPDAAYPVDQPTNRDFMLVSVSYQSGYVFPFDDGENQWGIRQAHMVCGDNGGALPRYIFQANDFHPGQYFEKEPDDDEKELAQHRFFDQELDQV